MKKTIWLWSFAIVTSLALNNGLIAKDKDEDEAKGEVRVEKLILVKDTGDKFDSVKQFKPTDTFGVLVQLNEAKDGTKVKGVWTAVDAGGMKNKKIFEKTVTFDTESLKNAKIKDRVDFTLSHDDPYPTGEYKFEVYLNGEFADSVEFEIEE